MRPEEEKHPELNLTSVLSEVKSVVNLKLQLKSKDTSGRRFETAAETSLDVSP